MYFTVENLALPTTFSDSFNAVPSFEFVLSKGVNTRSQGLQKVCKSKQFDIVRFPRDWFSADVYFKKHLKKTTAALNSPYCMDFNSFRAATTVQ